MIFLVFISIFLVIVLFLPIELQVKAKREQDNDKIQINISLLNKAIKFGIDVPFVDTIIRNKDILFEAEEKLETGKGEKDQSKKKKVVSMKTLVDKFHKYSRYQRFFVAAIRYLSKRIRIEKLVWKTTIGFQDAALTGVITGVIWTIKGLILGPLLSYKDIKLYSIDIKSEFNKTHFLINFNCIIKFKLVYIINAVIHGIMKQLKGGL